MGASITPTAVQATAVCLTHSHFEDVGETNNSCQFTETLLMHTLSFRMTLYRNPNCNLKSAVCKPPHPHPPHTTLQDACEFPTSAWDQTRCFHSQLQMTVTCSQTPGNTTCHGSISASTLMGLSSRLTCNVCAKSDKRSCRARAKKSVRGYCGKSPGACTGSRSGGK